MRWMLIGLFAGCGGGEDTTTEPLPEDLFPQQYEDKFCAAWADCGYAEECPATGIADQGHFLPSECVWDQALADECLNATFTCNSTDVYEGLNDVPIACNCVCGPQPYTNNCG